VCPMDHFDEGSETEASGSGLKPERLGHAIDAIDRYTGHTQSTGDGCRKVGFVPAFCYRLVVLYPPDSSKNQMRPPDKDGRRVNLLDSSLAPLTWYQVPNLLLVPVPFPWLLAPALALSFFREAEQARPMPYARASL
jgi:hypothetical protein